MNDICPICGGKILKGECISCGYVLPNEELIVAPYDYNPDDYNLSDENKQVIMDEIDTDTDKYPDFKVNETKNEVIKKAENIINNNSANISSKNNFNNVSPNSQQLSGTDKFIKDVVNFVVKRGWQFLFCIFLPSVGIIMGIYYMSKLKYKKDVSAFVYGVLLLVVSLACKTYNSVLINEENSLLYLIYKLFN